MNDEGRTNLHVAAITGDRDETIKILAEEDSQINAQDAYLQTPLMLASEKGHSIIVDLLLKDSRTEINLQDSFGRTALHWCAKHGDSKNITGLLKRDEISAKLRTTGGDEPIHWAVESNANTPTKMSIVQSLLNAGAQADLRNEMGFTPLDLAVNNACVLEILQHHLSKIEQKNNEFITQLRKEKETSLTTIAEPLIDSKKLKSKWGVSSISSIETEVKPSDKKKLKISLKKRPAI